MVEVKDRLTAVENDLATVKTDLASVKTDECLSCLQIEQTTVSLL